MFKVIEMFTDLQDDNFKYEVGDEYPRLGLKPSLARVNELSGTDNRRGHAVIEEVKDGLPFGDDAVTAEDEAPAEKPKKRGRKGSK